jgi:hypothetical protein
MVGDPNYTIDRFSPVVSLCYIAANLYAFGYIWNFWNGFDLLTLVYGILHLVMPVYSLALSAYQVPLAQFIIYYFSTTIQTFAFVLLFTDGALLCIGLLA